MAKIALVFLLVAMFVYCSAEEAKKDADPLATVGATVQEFMDKVKATLTSDEFKNTADQIGANLQTWFNETKANLEKMGEQLKQPK
ncbi:GH17156 [Drosophila grimshawi]|uniref:GH17156 n=1 Tax=Drosophila grimshawi TaxID=7222 RepID=B4J170_DROGR|nr:GH17156 [Drosophila grimshawi]